MTFSCFMWGVDIIANFVTKNVYIYKQNLAINSICRNYYYNYFTIPIFAVK